jgi:predicted anti-sigma-YlaC factor YlaD
VHPLTQDCAFTRELLPEHAMALLDPEQTAAVRQHLSVCGACRAEQEELAGVVGFLATIRDAFSLIADADTPDRSEHAPTGWSAIGRKRHPCPTHCDFRISGEGRPKSRPS